MIILHVVAVRLLKHRICGKICLSPAALLPLHICAIPTPQENIETTAQAQQITGTKCCSLGTDAPKLVFLDKVGESGGYGPPPAVIVHVENPILAPVSRLCDHVDLPSAHREEWMGDAGFRRRHTVMECS